MTELCRGPQSSTNRTRSDILLKGGLNAGIFGKFAARSNSHKLKVVAISIIT